MSIKLMSFVWDLDGLAMGRKLVLLSLADQANDAGQCFPSFETLQKRCGMSRRTLFDCLRDLEDGGYIDRIRVGDPGRERVIFQVNEEALRQGNLLVHEPPKATKKAGAKSAPVQNPHQCEISTGAENSTDPVRNLHSIKQPSNSNQERGARSPSGSRLPPDWKPSADDLEFARTKRPDLDLKTETDKFRDYFHAAPGVKGRRADWSATWRNWIRSAYVPKGGAGPVPGSVARPTPERDWREPTESPLERAIGYIRHQHALGALTDAERDAAIAEARENHAEVTA